MIIQIRVVIDVQLEDQDRFPAAIEKITDAIVEQFPGFKIARPHAPVIVTIKQLNLERPAGEKSATVDVHKS
jgi:hypothetical protein